MDLRTADGAQDPRVRRSRTALMRAAIELVTERETSAVPLSDIAQAADISRRVVYQHFGDRDTLLLEAGLDLARRELLPHLAHLPKDLDEREQALAVCRHFAEHRRYYRALLTGPCAFALNRGLFSLILPINRQGFDQWFDGRLTPQVLDDLAALLTGGASALITTWVVEADDPLDPEAFTDRLMNVLTVLLRPTALPSLTSGPEVSL